MKYSTAKPIWFSFDCLMLVVFAFVTAVINIPNAQRVLGLVLFLILLSKFINGREPSHIKWNKTPPELILFTLWVLWAAISGYFVTTLRWHYIQEIKFLFQMTALIWVIYAMLRIKMTPRLIFFAYILAALFQGTQALFGLISVVDETIAGGKSLEQVRAQGIGAATNSNALGGLMVTATFAALLFWNDQGKKITFRRILILGVMLFSMFLILRTGSRKSILYYFIIIGGWYAWAQPDLTKSGGFFKRIMAVIFVGLVLGFVVPHLLRNTSVGNRWAQFFERGDGSILSALEEDGRYWLYMNGFRMLEGNWVAGVGIGHYQVYSIGNKVSHSDYMEVLANTGIVGFILYHSIKFVLLFRLLKLRKLARSFQERYIYNMLTLFVIFYFFYGLGFHIYGSQQMMLRLITVSTFSHVCMLGYKRHTPLWAAARGI